MGALETIFGLVALAAFFWVTYDVWTNRSSRYTTVAKVLWTVSAFFLSIVTAAVYYFIDVRNRR